MADEPGNRVFTVTVLELDHEYFANVLLRVWERAGPCLLVFPPTLLIIL